MILPPQSLLLFVANTQTEDDSGSLAPIIIWVVIGAFWVLAQIVQKKNQTAKLQDQARQMPPPDTGSASMSSPPPPASHSPATQTAESSIEDEMRSFLEQITGNTPQPPQPQKASLPPPAPARKVPPVGPPPIPASRKRAASNPRLQFDAPPPQPLPTPLPIPSDFPTFDESIYAIDDDVYGQDTEIIDIVDLEKQIEGESLDADQALVNVRAFITKLDTLTVPIMSTQLLSMRPVRTRTSRPNLKNREAMRQAVIARIILSQPKALHDDIMKTDKGAM